MASLSIEDRESGRISKKSVRCPLKTEVRLRQSPLKTESTVYIHKYIHRYMPVYVYACMHVGLLRGGLYWHYKFHDL